MLITTTTPITTATMGDITVECAAIRILKNSTKGGAVTNAGAVFSVEGPSPATDSFNVTDDETAAAPDEDSDIGEVCVSGLEPGIYTVNETTPPAGYGDASETDVAVEAVAGTDCGDNLPGIGGTATFVNPPLFNVQIRWQDGGSLETSLVGIIDCDNPTGIDDTSDTTGWDDTLTVNGIEVPASGQITIECTLTVDP